jgi:NAD(P)-dependent dehydrogenase (short-subunit alcohol dehydrogenase family)
VTASSWTASDLPDLHGQTVVVTGANSGIGRVTAKALAAAGASVTLAVRNIDKGRQAAAGMAGTVDVRPLDLTELASVEAFAAGWRGDLDILIDNAGIMATPLGRTRDGFELQIGTNHLGHFALTNRLLPHITNRVVVVSSSLHRRGRIDLDDLNWERRRYRAWPAYGQSKLANLLFVLELQRRLDAIESPVVALAAHPGYASTNLQAATSSRLQRLAMKASNALFAQSDEMGALPTLYAATQDLPGRTFVGPGGFREVRGSPMVVAPAGAALDGDMARRLWDLSERLTGVTWPPFVGS